MILVVEDNPRLSKNIVEYLELEKFKVEAVRDGKTGLEKALTGKYSCILLDINLPIINGMEICQEVRKQGVTTPILMLTARGDLDDRVNGLNIGADDYVIKPFEFEELIARIRVLLRQQSPQKSEILKLGNLSVDFTCHEVKKGKEFISLSPKEFAILEFLIRNKGRVKSRTEILIAVWGEAEENALFGSDTVEVHISYLRKKLGKNIIETVRGIGYKIA